MIEILQYAPQLGPAAAVLVVVLMFLRHLAGDRRERARAAARVERIIRRNTVAQVRMTAALARMERAMLRFADPQRAAQQTEEDEHGLVSAAEH